MKIKQILLLGLCLAGATSLYSEENRVVSIVGKVSVCEVLEADNGGFPFCLKIDILSPENVKDKDMPYLFFKDLNDLKVLDGTISTADIVSLDVPKKFFAPRKVGDTFRRVCMNDVKNLKLVTKCPPEKQPKSVFEGGVKQSPKADSQSDGSGNSRSGPLPPPPGWPTGSKQEPPAKSTCTSESQPVNKEAAGK
jgi:hypothetical protein